MVEDTGFSELDRISEWEKKMHLNVNCGEENNRVNWFGAFLTQILLKIYTVISAPHCEITLPLIRIYLTL